MQLRSIKINGQVYNYYLRRWPRAKYIRFTMKADGKLIVTAPKIYPLYLIKNFIIAHQKWIFRNWQKVKLKSSLFSIKHTPTEVIKLKEQTAKLVKTRLEYFKQIYRPVFDSEVAQTRGEGGPRQKRTQRPLGDNFQYNRVSIRNQSTRWGSCSRRGNLNFNCRLCLLPPELADYVIIHEFCHLQEMNHGSNFWNLVSRARPDYKNLRARLRKI